MRKLLLAGTFVAALTGSAEALTIRDILELTRAGLGEEVLLALIEVDRGVYAIDTATLKQLKAAGVTDRVLVALVRSGREAPVELPAPIVEPPDSQPNTQVVVIDHRDVELERVREVPVPIAVPVYVPVIRGSRRHAVGSATFDASNFVPFQSGPPASRPVLRKEEPVYWGWGGKRRPDSWDPFPEHGKVKPPDRRK